MNLYRITCDSDCGIILFEDNGNVNADVEVQDSTGMYTILYTFIQIQKITFKFWTLSY